jgi:5'-3' exonuclease
MGIRGAFTTLRKAFHTLQPLELQPLSIAIDMFSLVYTHRACLDELLELLKSWSEHGHVLTCIWDGTAPKEKQEIIGQRRSARDSAMDKKKDLEEYLDKFASQLDDTDIKHLKSAITSLSWQGWHLSGSLKRQIQESLGGTIQHVYAPGEADDVLIEMGTRGKTDVIVSLDSDLLAMGSPRLWRLLKIRKEWIVEDISVEEVCNTFGVSLSLLQDACFLAGWDRCHLSGVTYMPFDVALNRMKHYGILGVVIEKFISEAQIDKEAYERLKMIKKESKDMWVDILKKRETQYAI